MVGQLRKELGKRHDFDCIEQEAHLNLIRTADMLQRVIEERVFTPAELSDTQYNVLRILRGSSAEEPDGLKCSDIAARLIARDPDITRLVDRLVKRGLVQRKRDANDRRVVRVTITQQGIDLIKPLDQPLIETHQSLLGNMPKRELTSLIRSLERIRESLGAKPKVANT